jgi:hypothetical protein
MRRPSGPWIAAYALLVGTVVVAGRARTGPAERAAAVARETDEVRGLWRAGARGGDLDPVAFYYFHGDGKGLYRYGVGGLSNTHSFDYELASGELRLKFRKTGERASTPYHVESTPEGGARLVLERDPRREGATGVWVREEAADPANAAPRPDGRLWIDLRNYATGGSGFALYQLRDAGIDGRGVGWFHRGDFDDWSTEALTFRIRGEVIDLHFTVRNEQRSTTFARVPGENGGTALRLAQDPRDYGAPHRYEDGGPSFGTRDAGCCQLGPLSWGE